MRHFAAISAHEVGRWGLSDEEQLTYATMENRAIFTYNTADYLKLHLGWPQRGQEHSGIIVANQLSIGETMRRLLNLLNQVTADEIQNQTYWLQAFK